MLKIEHLKKSFDHPVLEDLSLDIQPGDLIYIHGINGCGKTTLFKIIAGLLTYDEGILIQSPTLHIGALIENPQFLEHKSLKFNLFFLSSLKNNTHQKRIHELCTLFELDDTSQEKMKNYSLGMKQKAGIIQAIMEDQNFIMFDEPTRGLDEKAIQTFCQLITTLHKQGKTILIASHDYLEAIPFTVSYCLENGRLYIDETLPSLL